ncbi:MAG: sigma-70 family RNA polymerase sigma factor [Bryobacteraceae bacterium]|nr:sigma-70 family RNA polymerase sigma factor [Bryobacteraceae bacterium]
MRFEFDANYMDRLRSGDRDTENHFCSYFGQLLGIKLRTRLRSSQLVDDVRQETFLRVFALLRREGGVRKPEFLGSLVNSVCNNVLLENYRSSGRLAASTEEPDCLAAKTQSAQDRVEAEEKQSQVQNVLAQLPERDRSILRAIFWDDADKDEICQSYGVQRDYLRVLVFRAKQLFRARYKTA